jgi:hypothetical protein
MSAHTPWLWPDHCIGKRESRRLREEHNATVNDCADLLAACKYVVAWTPDTEKWDPETARDLLNAAILKAEGGDK